MRAGTLRERVELVWFQPTDGGEWGQPHGTWTTWATVWANVTATGGGEIVKDDAPQASTTYTVRMRYRDDVTAEDRLVRRGKTLEIVSVIDPDGRRRELLIQAMEHRANG